MVTIGMSKEFKVKTLLALGCKRWTKNDMDRIYLGEDQLLRLLNIKASYYGTGKFEQDGETLASLNNCKFYYNINSDSYGYKHYQGYVDLHNAVFKRLDEYLASKHDAQKPVRAIPEITLDELNTALGF